MSSRTGRAAGRASFDRHSAVLFVVAIPLIAALALYVFQAVELSVQPTKPPPTDLTLSPGGRPTAHGTAEVAFMMLHAQPPSRELAARVTNFVFQRVDSSPESESLRASARQLRRAADQGDTASWDAAVDDVCHLAGHC